MHAEPMRTLTPAEFRDVIGHFASGVTVITTRSDDRPHGTTASAVASLSLEPPMLLVCINKDSATGRVIERTGRFAVNILSEDQADLAVRFASKEPEKFAGIATTTGIGGNPLLTEALAVLECRVAQDVSGGTHTVFLAEVDHGTARTGAPLAYFRGQFGRLELVHDAGTLALLRERVVTRSIGLDQPLEAGAIADELSVPRGAAYYALSRLANEGLLARGGDGSFEVLAVTFDVARDALLARATIEMGVAMQRAGSLTPAERERLRMAWEVSEDAFLEATVRLAGSDAVLAAYRRIDGPVRIVGAGSLGSAAHDHHAALLAAYLDGDPVQACAVIRERTDAAIEILRQDLADRRV